MKESREGKASRADRFAAVKTDALAWVQSMRFSALSVVLLGIVITAAVVLTPNISIFVQQQNEITQLRESVELHRKTVSEAESAKLKWQDPVYIRAQARERLFYMMPGQTQLTVIADGVEIPEDQTNQVSKNIESMPHNWPLDFANSVLQAGITDADPQDIQQYK